MRRNDFFKSLLFGGGANAASRTKLETETLPYTFYTQPQTLKNYRIYGNTVNGESVGDWMGNLANKDDITRVSISINNGILKVEGTNRRLTLQCNVKENVTYTVKLFNDSLNYNNKLTLRSIYAYNEKLSINSVTTDYVELYNTYSPFLDVFTFTIPTGYSVIAITMRNYTDSLITDSLIDDSNYIMLVEGDTAPSTYEPYGYRVPVTVTNGVDTQTTNLYLPEQIKMVGDEAEYIDFREQKQHFADGTSADVTLPAIPILFNTNTLSVGTTVQPSKVYLQGKISETEIVSARSLQTNMQSLQPLSLDNDDLQLDVMPSDGFERYRR